MWVKVKWLALGILGNTDQNMGGFGEDKGMWTTAYRSRVLHRRRRGVRYRWDLWVQVKWAALGILWNTDQNMGGFGEDKGMWTTAYRSRVLLMRRQGVSYRWDLWEIGRAHV